MDEQSNEEVLAIAAEQPSALASLAATMNETIPCAMFIDACRPPAGRVVR